jgi:hypothetical protein
VAPTRPPGIDHPLLDTPISATVTLAEIAEELLAPPRHLA